MKNKWSNLLCTFLLFFSSNLIHAKTGEFDVGMQFKTTKIFNIENAITDYYLFNSGDLPNQDLKNNIFLYKEANKLLKFVNVPLTVGIHFRFSYYFTPKIGISFSPELFYGNIAAAKVSDTEKRKIGISKGIAIDEGRSEFYKIRVVGLGGDVRFLYDVLGSSLDFCDYERNQWKGTVSLGAKCDWFCNKKLMPGMLTQLKDKLGETSTTNSNEILSGDRIISFVPGLILGGDIVAPFNLGVGIDIAWYFRNLFSVDDKIKEHDNKSIRDFSKNGGNGFIPQYSTSCSFLQAAIRIYYDFAPFINNHEAPSEIDIEKW